MGWKERKSERGRVQELCHAVRERFLREGDVGQSALRDG